MNLENLAESMQYVNSIRAEDDISIWDATVDGKNFRWKAQITQLIPNEAIGWKSVSGPKHTGRITFSPIDDDTLVHVTMNYAPPLGGFGAMLPIDQHLEDWIERALREFKAGLESSSPELRTGTTKESFTRKY